MSKRSSLRGPKFSGAHQTYIEEAVDFLEFCRNCDAIKKVTLGMIRTAKPVRNQHIKQKQTRTAIEVVIRGVGAVQTFYIVGEDWEQCTSAITSFIEN